MNGLLLSIDTLRSEQASTRLRGVQVTHLSNSRCSRKQSSIDGFGALKRPYINNQIDQRVESGNRTPVLHFRMFDAEFFGVAVNALATGALRVDGVVERPIPVERDPLDAAEFPVDIFDTAFAFDELLVVAGFSGGFRTEQGATKALTAI